MSLRISFLVYPDITQLDLTGAHEFLSRVPGAECRLVWKERTPVRSDAGLLLTPDAILADVRETDVLCVPGGPGQIPLMDDAEVLSWLADVGETAKYVTSVCVGSLLLGAAGLLSGYRAACHWASLDLLSAYGAEPCADRVVIDRNRVTGGGVTAGIDFGLQLAALLSSEATAKTIQLALEYNPAPPFDAGHPSTAPSETVALLRERFAPRLLRRAEQAARYSAAHASAAPPKLAH